MRRAPDPHAVCSVDGCGKKHKALGFCNTHYRRVLHNGTLVTKNRERGTGWIGKGGYIYMTHDGERRPVHVVVAEKAVGRRLPLSNPVHHVNGDRTDNRPANLVICQSHAYHNLLHARMRALEQCGNADWRKCQFCKRYDAPENLVNGKGFHAACVAADVLRRYHSRASA